MFALRMAALLFHSGSAARRIWQSKAASPGRIHRSAPRSSHGIASIFRIASAMCSCERRGCAVSWTTDSSAQSRRRFVRDVVEQHLFQIDHVPRSGHAVGDLPSSGALFASLAGAGLVSASAAWVANGKQFQIGVGKIRAGRRRRIRHPSTRPSLVLHGNDHPGRSPVPARQPLRPDDLVFHDRGIGCCSGPRRAGPSPIFCSLEPRRRQAGHGWPRPAGVDQFMWTCIRQDGASYHPRSRAVGGSKMSWKAGVQR